MQRDLRRLLRSVREAFTSVGWNRASGRLGISLLVVSAVFFAANFADKAWVSYQASQQKQQRIVAIQTVQGQIQALKQDLSYGRSKAYYMQQAQSAYGYVQPGDIELQLNVQTVPSAPGDQPTAKPSATAKHSDSVLHRLLQAVVPGL